DNPLGGKWNYEEENRKPLPSGIRIPCVTNSTPDSITKDIGDEVQKPYADHYGYIDEFRRAVTRRDALKLFDQFIEERLSKFGPFEDAMAAGQPFLFHSVLSTPYPNTGLLCAREVCEKLPETCRRGSSAEGFVRQIIGWGEFVRIYYEALMPDTLKTNYFGYMVS
ncbi:MAG TPA: cryptochrome/photolyase family protein, partial [Balneolales bacterium]|nr:cryptochrome/photolyase family protein [Balneolales bacterium]